MFILLYIRIHKKVIRQCFILGEKLSFKHCEALEEVLRRLQFNLIDLEGCYLEDEVNMFVSETENGVIIFAMLFVYYK